MMATAPENHQSSTEYERIVQKIFQTILKRDGVSTVDVQHNQKVKGKSGVAHQIDVMWRFKQAGVVHIVAIECKNYSSAVEVGDVRNFAYVIDDIGARGVIVTRVGFQSGAREAACFEGIELKLVREPREEDWDGLIRDIDIHISLKAFDRSNIPDVKLNIAKEYGSLVQGAVIEGNPTDLRLLDKDGNFLTPRLGEWIVSVVPILEKDAGGPYKHDVKTPEAFVRLKRSDGTDVAVPVDSISVTYHVSELTSEVTVDGGEGVTQVLKNFETGEVEHFQRKE